MSQQNNWIDIAQKAFNLEQEKLMHITDIANSIQKHSLTPTMSTDKIQSNLNSALANHVKKKGDIFSKPNIKGQKRGWYRLKRTQKQAIVESQVEESKFSTNYRGRAGEYAFISELLFREYNASLVTVDLGMDIVALKNNKTFMIQVKTSSQRANGSFQATIKQESFEHSSSIFYVVVMRENLKNNFFILSSNDLRTLLRKGGLKNGNNININISKKGEKFFIAGTEDITHHINDFSVIK